MTIHSTGGKPELSRLTIGHMPLADAAPLLWAQHRGHFEAAGLDVKLVCEASWASLRDRLAWGVFDAAQCLAPMPLAAQLGIDGAAVPMVSALCLSRGGSSVTLSMRLLDALDVSPEAPPAVVARAIANRAEYGPPLRFAHVFAYSMHHYLLRDWLESGGVDTDTRVEFRVAPPPQMVRLLEAGEVDGFCAGEPWSTAAMLRGQGRPVVASRQIWAGGPEKVLGVTAEWARRHPATHRALVAALLRAQHELHTEQHSAELAEVMAGIAHIDLPAGWLQRALAGEGVDAPSFDPADAMLRPSQMLWCLMQMVLRGQIASPVDAMTVTARTCDTACFRDAAALADVPVSAADYCVEGIDGGFLAGPALDPAQPERYLAARGLPPERARQLLLLESASL
jgi:ABC-type nitrate/sulfonate/bicarbonate transport system substrate-binding protein